MKKYYGNAKNGNSKGNNFKKRPSAKKEYYNYMINPILPQRNNINLDQEDLDSFIYDVLDALSESIYEESSTTLMDALTIPVQIKRSLVTGVSTDKGVITIGKLIGFDKRVSERIQVLIYPNYVDTVSKIGANTVQVNTKVFTSYVPDGAPEVNYQITYLELVCKEESEEDDSFETESTDNSYYKGLEEEY